MKIRIYRGTHQIGGCITEITTEKSRIIIDMGVSLPPSKSAAVIDGVTRHNGSKRCDAVIFTHYHIDHVGLAGDILPEIPMYIGASAKEILLLQQRHKKSALASAVERMNTYDSGTAFTAGDIRITPIPTDHSAYDAYMLLIEGENQKILHTGDFRTHGIKGLIVEPVL